MDPQPFPIDAAGRVPFKGSLAVLESGFISYPRCIPTSLLQGGESKSLLQDMKTSMSAREVEEDGQYSLGDTFFLPATVPPRCGLEALAKSFFDFHTKDAEGFDPERSGAEWWTQVIDMRDDIGVHFDRDYGMEEYGLNIHPHVASVTYLTDIGGPTIVTPHVSGPEAGADFSGSQPNLFLSYPEVGKHMAFDGRFLHAAPGDLIPEKSKGFRYTFLVNIWLNHCPINSDLLPDEHLKNMKWKPAPDQAPSLNFDSPVSPAEIKLGAGKGEASAKTLEMKFILDDYRARLKIPFGVAAIKEAVAGKGSICELKFEGEDQLLIERGAEVVEGEEEESSDEDEEDEESSDDDEDVSLGSEDTDSGAEKPKKKQKKQKI
ncbi:hypothetical protein TrVE_jg11681 [Triparma verrucosa]|uniref:Uncharacterized protein n=1 Tax=Triparma verrucosa TaxID=1606542 RepID=A0A9W7BP78_9STRA|nr:hypothetical protein TrVE_jg11681 [Triparma verrucosa]